MEKLTMCLYCGKWFKSETMTPLYEKNKEWVKHYCKRCKPEVDSNLRSLHWYKNYRWGWEGQDT